MNFFPMDIETFLDGGHLSRADIVLVRGTSLFSRAIRFATRSPFSHAALIFLIPDRQSGFERTFLIEAVPKGISIRGIADAIGAGPGKGPKTALAVLRLERPWFNADVQKIVRGRMLDFVRAGYDWSTILGIATSVISGMFLGQASYARAMRSSLTRDYEKKRLVPADFICSGLVQYGFLRTIFDLSDRDGTIIPIGGVADAIFSTRLTGVDPEKIIARSPRALAELLAITPDEISRAPTLTWKYVLVDGKAHAVANRDDAMKVLEVN
ncbi:MAG: hypothetical protein WEC00_13355 [Dongiaceae bacterium]